MDVPQQLHDQCFLLYPISANNTISCSRSSKQPHPSKQAPHRNEEAEPHFPPNSCLLSHSEHSPHGTLQSHSRIVETVVHLVCEGGRIADLIPDGNGELFELADFGGQDGRAFGLVLGLERFEDGVRVLTSAVIISKPTFYWCSRGPYVL